jgi:L-amino acid N-acyltransferase YncA
MSTFSLHRASERDLDAIRRFCDEATAGRSTLLSVRHGRLDPAAWIVGRAPIVVVSEGNEPVGMAAAVSEHVPCGAPRCAEVIVYVAPGRRRRGAAKAALAELLTASRTMGLWKFIGHALTGDAAARGMLDKHDFREVGTLVKHVQLEGAWHDVVVYERLVLAARKSFPSLSGI